MTPEVAAAITVVTAVPGVFSFFCPSVLDVNKHNPDEVRLQQAKSVVCSLVLGGAGSAATKTPWPFLMACAITALVLWEYETAHRREA